MTVSLVVLIGRRRRCFSNVVVAGTIFFVLGSTSILSMMVNASTTINNVDDYGVSNKIEKEEAVGECTPGTITMKGQCEQPQQEEEQHDESSIITSNITSAGTTIMTTNDDSICIDQWTKSKCLEAKVKGQCIVQSDEEDENDDESSKQEKIIVEETLSNCLSTCGVCALLDSTELFGVRQGLPLSVTKSTEDGDEADENQITSLVEYVDELRTMISYMRKRLEAEEDSSDDDDEDEEPCTNDDEDCLLTQHYCTEGDEVTIQTMMERCSPVCGTCHLRNDRIRCRSHWLPNDKPRHAALNPGDLDVIFQRIEYAATYDKTTTLPSFVKEDDDTPSMLLYDTTNVTSEQEWFTFVHDLQPVIHSKPNKYNASATITNMTVTDHEGEEFDVDERYPPWVVTFENFLSPEEAQIFIDLGYEKGYERSGFYSEEPDENGMYDDSTVDDFRTSENTWYKVKDGHPLAKQVMERIGYVVGISPQYAEDYQLLKYETSQHYGYHHDYHNDLLKVPCGPRILTFFLYLNDMPDDESGGGTRFNDLGNLTITPKRGRAVLWPNVQSEYPDQMEEWTFHEAMPVLKGQKFGSNIWYHLYDYQSPLEDGCT